MRRVVTRTNEEDKSVFVSDENTTRVVKISAAPQFKMLDMIWGTDGGQKMPIEAKDITPEMLFIPQPGGSRFFLNLILPDKLTDSLSPDETLALYSEYLQQLPGFAECFDLTRLGMHRSNTIEYGYIISGQVYLELDDEQKVLLKSGDCWVNNAAMHAWRNPFDEPCLSVISMFGV